LSNLAPMGVPRGRSLFGVNDPPKNLRFLGGQAC